MKFNTAPQERTAVIYGIEDYVVKSEENFGLCGLKLNPKMVRMKGQEDRQSVEMGSPFGRFVAVCNSSGQGHRHRMLSCGQGQKAESTEVRRTFGFD